MKSFSRITTKSLVNFAKTAIMIFGIGVFAQMMHVYGKHRTNIELNLNFLFVAAACFISGISIYLLMYSKYIKDRRPSIVVPVERWFTVNPFLTFAIVISYLTSVVFLALGLWPVYEYYGVIFSILLFLVLQQVAAYSPI